jgi:hypothetical protein
MCINNPVPSAASISCSFTRVALLSCYFGIHSTYFISLQPSHIGGHGSINKIFIYHSSWEGAPSATSPQAFLFTRNKACREQSLISVKFPHTPLAKEPGTHWIKHRTRGPQNLRLHPLPSFHLPGETPSSLPLTPLPWKGFRTLLLSEQLYPCLTVLQGLRMGWVLVISLLSDFVIVWTAQSALSELEGAAGPLSMASACNQETW